MMQEKVGSPWPILLTGHASGIGKAIHEYLRLGGRSVITVGRGEHTDIKIDFSGAFSRNQFAEQVEDFAPVGVYGVINCAAIADATPFDEIKEEDFQDMMQVNLISPWKIVSSLWKKDMIQTGGRVINIGSISSLMGFSGHAHYCASKFALRGLTMVLAKEMAKRKVTCNLVAPGPTDTPMWQKLVGQYAEMAGPGVSEGDIGEVAMSRGLFGRIGEVGDVVGVVRFLLSKEASFITGATLNVSGGNLLG